MSSLSLGIDEIIAAISVIDPDVSVFCAGQPGVGKSSMANIIAERRTQLTGKHHSVFVLDCTCADVGDVVIPNIQEVRGLTQVVYAPNSAFGIGQDNPVVILLDEFGKASKPVQDALLPIILEHRAGHYKLPDGSIVIATTNLVSDGVGDMIQAHAYNRVTCLTMRNPTSEEWRRWAINNDVEPIIIAAAQQFPSFFQMYAEPDAKNNSYIFDPVHHPERNQFVTPRSLVKAGEWLRSRKSLTPNTMIAALSGTIGEAAARDMLTLVTLSDSLASPEEVLKNPSKVAVPDKAVGQLILGLNVLRLGKPSNCNDVVTFVLRLKPEVRAVLASTMLDGAYQTTYMMAEKLVELATSLKKYQQTVA